MEQVRDPGQVILDEVAALEIQRARIEAAIACGMLAFADLRRREAEAAPNARIRDLEISFAADELALVLLQPTRTVQCRLADARRTRNLMPKAWEAFRAGTIDAWRVRLISSAADKLSDRYALIQLDYEVVAYASKHTGSQLKSWLNRFVAREEPDRVAERVKLETQKRAVWVDHQDDGMSHLTAYIPTPEAIRIDHDLTHRAKLSPAEGRSFDNVRADLLCDKLLGSGAGSGRGTSVIGVTIPVTSLAGLTDEPGESFDGSYALPAQLVRDLAAEPGTLFCRIITDPLGHILDIAELGRYPSRKLKTALQIKDGTCAFATCSRPSVECDNDHTIPHPRGPTSGRNLRGFCRRHHHMKTHGIVRTSMDKHGHHITLPTGKTIHSESRRLLPSAAISGAEHRLATWLSDIDFVA